MNRPEYQSHYDIGVLYIRCGLRYRCIVYQSWFKNVFIASISKYVVTSWGGNAKTADKRWITSYIKQASRVIGHGLLSFDDICTTGISNIIIIISISYIAQWIARRNIYALYNEYLQSTVDKLLILMFTMLLMLLWPVLLCLRNLTEL